jgi:hypothetical protein
VKASQLTELEEFISNYPPHFSGSAQARRPEGSLRESQKTVSKVMSTVRLVAAAIVILVTVIYLVGQFTRASTNYSYQILTASTDPEHAYRSSYLSTGGTYRPNFWQTKEEISGTVTNKALHTNYKVVHIRVNFFSQTKNIIRTQDYVVYQYVPYGSTQSFTIKVIKPQATASCGWVVTGATYY